MPYLNGRIIEVTITEGSTRAKVEVINILNNQRFSMSTKSCTLRELDRSVLSYSKKYRVHRDNIHTITINTNKSDCVDSPDEVENG